MLKSAYFSGLAAATLILAATSVPSMAQPGDPTEGGKGGKIVKVTTLAKDGPGSLAAALWAARQGAAIVRVHDVAETVQALAMFQTLCYNEVKDTKAE